MSVKLLIGPLVVAIVTLCVDGATTQTPVINTKQLLKKSNKTLNVQPEDDEFGDRIVGGSYVIPHTYPFVVRIQKYHMMHCGGSLISENVVLTAAHCVFKKFGEKFYPEGARKFTLYLGDNERNVKEEGEEQRKVSKIIVHEGYIPGTTNNDIALLVMKKPVKFTEYILPIELSSEDQPPGSLCTTIGWGTTNSSLRNSESAKLKELMMPIVDAEVCKEADNMTRDHFNPETMLCAQHIALNQDSCTGDSGGPLFCETEPDRFKQIATVSWGPRDCGDGSFPGVYARLSYYYNWIIHKVGENSINKN